MLLENVWLLKISYLREMRALSFLIKRSKHLKQVLRSFITRAHKDLWRDPVRSRLSWVVIWCDLVKSHKTQLRLGQIFKHCSGHRNTVEPHKPSYCTTYLFIASWVFMIMTRNRAFIMISKSTYLYLICWS